jgi:DNA gyrase subunit B
MSAEETEVLVNPDLRIIKQITVEDVKKADELFDQLMGTAILPRKEFIKAHSKEATYAN